jgi:hypothetical protein
MGGIPPLGYRARDSKLVVIASEAEIVRAIFRRYAELGSVRLLKDEHRNDRPQNAVEPGYDDDREHLEPDQRDPGSNTVPATSDRQFGNRAESERECRKW